MTPLKIGNAQAFWGDRQIAALELVTQVPTLDYLTLDYLAEVSMSILAIQREKDPQAGYAKDFIDVVYSLIPHLKKEKPLKIITNAGGLNPEACAIACQKLLEANGVSLKIAYISGDDVLKHLKNDDASFTNLDTGEDISKVKDQLISANVYLGSKPIVDALNLGATLVITGRVADPCLVSSACIHHFQWKQDEYDKIGSAIVAGHLLECGTQVTGGCSTNWLHYENMEEVGFPYVEMNKDGSFIITKSESSGGVVNIETVKEQLLYEIGDPDNYLSPDVAVSFLKINLSEQGKNRIKVEGVTGKAPPSTYKVSATYEDGFRVDGMISIFGRDCYKKALRCKEIIEYRLKKAGCYPQEFHYECLGTGDIVPLFPKKETIETVLRIAAKNPQKEALEFLAKEIAPLVTHGPQGTTGYMSGRPKVRSVFSFWPTLIESKCVSPTIGVIGS